MEEPIPCHTAEKLTSELIGVVKSAAGSSVLGKGECSMSLSPIETYLHECVAFRLAHFPLRSAKN